MELVKIIIPIIVIILLFYFFLYKNTLMFFYSNKCSHCVNFKPIWKQVENELSGNTEKINCDINPEICDTYNIDAFPQILKVSPFGSIEVYSGNRNLDDILNFYN